MPQLYKCTECDHERATFATRTDALKAGWTFVTAECETSLKYRVLGPAHKSLDWVRKALLLDKKDTK